MDPSPSKPWENGGRPAVAQSGSQQARPLTNIQGGSRGTTLANNTGYNASSSTALARTNIGYGGYNNTTNSYGYRGGMAGGTGYGAGRYGSTAIGAYGGGYSGYGSGYRSGYGSSYGGGYGSGYGTGYGYGGRGIGGRMSRYGAGGFGTGYGGGYGGYGGGYNYRQSYGDRSNLATPKFIGDGLEATQGWMDRMVDVLDTFGMVSTVIEDNCHALHIALTSFADLFHHLSAMGINMGGVLLKVLGPFAVVYRLVHRWLGLPPLPALPADTTSTSTSLSVDSFQEFQSGGTTSSGSSSNGSNGSRLPSAAKPVLMVAGVYAALYVVRALYTRLVTSRTRNQATNNNNNQQQQQQQQRQQQQMGPSNLPQQPHMGPFGPPGGMGGPDDFGMMPPWNDTGDTGGWTMR
eukprot:TRINITY_DN348_c0_g1_i1.p2 TRINITY_DN348_c0_g1~~TRINITY_DN348_c0_g1_i1.p2  ORF type:complete len:405 (+),score=49.07 TRINITY_DN348_c0_g1_i1:110-1324(+)